MQRRIDDIPRELQSNGQDNRQSLQMACTKLRRPDVPARTRLRNCYMAESFAERVRAKACYSSDLGQFHSHGPNVRMRRYDQRAV